MDHRSDGTTCPTALTSNTVHPMRNLLRPALQQQWSWFCEDWMQWLLCYLVVDTCGTGQVTVSSSPPLVFSSFCLFHSGLGHCTYLPAGSRTPGNVPLSLAWGLLGEPWALCSLDLPGPSFLGTAHLWQSQVDSSYLWISYLVSVAFLNGLHVVIHSDPYNKSSWCEHHYFPFILK